MIFEVPWAVKPGTDRPLCKSDTCTLRHEHHRKGYEDYSGYCGPSCREDYFRSIGAGDFLEVELNLKAFNGGLPTSEMEYIRSRPSPG